MLPPTSRRTVVILLPMTGSIVLPPKALPTNPPHARLGSQESPAAA